MKKFVSLFLSLAMLFSITAGLDFSAYAKSNPYPGNSNTNCTYYVWQRTKDKLGIELPAWGDAKTWYDSAKKAGYPVSSVPKADWIGVYGGGTQYNNQNRGHVIYVESVSGNTMKYSEGGYKGSVHSGTRNISANADDKKLLGYFNPNKNGSVTITFNGNGGTASASSLKVNKGGKMGDNIPTATGRNGYTFRYWTDSNGEIYDANTVINSNVTLKAIWDTNNTTVLKNNRIYRIINNNSGMAMQANGSENKALVTQRPISNDYGQLWRVSLADSNGNYRFTNLKGGRMLDVTGGSSALRNELEVYDNNNSDSQAFSVVYRGGFYSIHSKRTGRAFDIRNYSTEAGGQLQQYYYHGRASQQFRFEEVTNRTVKFYDNLNDSYLPSPKEVYNHSGGSTPKDCYISRNTAYATTSINYSQNKLIINQKKAGSSGNDLIFDTTVSDSYNYNMCNGDTNTKYIYFKAKASVSGAKMYFRWGYDTTYYVVDLSTTLKTYYFGIPRTSDSGSDLHPYIDKACTVEISDIELTDGNNFADDYKDDTYNYQTRNYNINSNNGKYGSLPTPKTTKNGYVFDGWYTRRVGGTKVTENTSLLYNTKLYAHWTKITPETCNHNYDSGNVTKSATCSSTGVKTYTCTICGATKTETISKTSHSYDSGRITTQANCYQNGVKTYTCKTCGATKTETIAKTSHNYSWKDSGGYVVNNCNNCGNEKVRLPFEDLYGYEYYGDYIAYTSVYNKFIIGTNPPARTLFSPTTPITRAMFVTILYRMAGEPYANNNPYRTSPFTDITDTSVYYYDAACWALDKGITNQTTFKPFDDVSREQTASFLFRYAKDNDTVGDGAYKNVNLKSYPDYNSVHGWAVEAMQWANYNGMITGTQQNTLNPQGATQRIHATKILYGFGKVCNIGNFA